MKITTIKQLKRGDHFRLYTNGITGKVMHTRGTYSRQFKQYYTLPHNDVWGMGIYRNGDCKVSVVKLTTNLPIV